MKTLQQIIEEMKSDIQDEERLYTWRSCLEYYVPKLELLLNEQPKVIEQMIKEAEHKLEQPNAKVDNYRAYWEGRISLAKQLLELQQAPVMLSLPSDDRVQGDARISEANSC